MYSAEVSTVAPQRPTNSLLKEKEAVYSMMTSPGLLKHVDPIVCCSFSYWTDGQWCAWSEGAGRATSVHREPEAAPCVDAQLALEHLLRAAAPSVGATHLR